MSRKLTEKFRFEQKLVELVKKRPNLYVKTSPGYCDAIVRANSWKKIYDLLGENETVYSGEGCEKLWTSIWSQYLSFKRKLKGYTGQGGGNRPYFRLEKAMQAFNDKSFQESTYTNDDTACNDEEHDNVSPQVIQSVTVEDGEITIVDFPSVPSFTTQSQTSSIDITTPESVSAPIPLLKPRSHDKKRKDRDFDEELLEVLKSQSSMDEFEAFATAVAIKLRKMESKKATEMQFLIHQLIYNFEKGAQNYKVITLYKAFENVLL